MFVLHQIIEHVDSNLAKNHNSSMQVKRKIKKFCPKFLTFLKFRTLEGTVATAFTKIDQHRKCNKIVSFKLCQFAFRLLSAVGNSKLDKNTCIKC